MTIRRVLVGLVLLLAVAGCQKNRSGARMADSVAGAPTTMVGQQAHQPAEAASACTATTTTALVKGFSAALSSGRLSDVDAFFAPASRSCDTPPPSGRPAAAQHGAGPRQPARHLQRRQANQERIKVDSVDFNGYRDVDRTAHFGMLLRRTADDIPGDPQLLGGKGGRLRLPAADGDHRQQTLNR